MPEEQILCPICEDFTSHITIRNGHELLVKCTSCGLIHSIPKERRRYADLSVIVSRDGLSRRYKISIPGDEVLQMGDDLVVDDELHDLVLAEITSLEGVKRYNNAPASEIKTVWARAIDEVVVKISIYSDGKTKSLDLKTNGDRYFEEGKIEVLEGTRIALKRIKLRKGGFVNSAKAKEILRIWGKQI